MLIRVYLAQVEVQGEEEKDHCSFDACSELNNSNCNNKSLIYLEQLEQANHRTDETNAPSIIARKNRGAVLQKIMHLVGFSRRLR